VATALLMSSRHQEALSEADVTVAINPNYAWGYGCQGGTRVFGGQPSEAFAPLKTAMRLSPFDPLMHLWLHWLSRAHYLTKD
jgi:adenylate cyclase